METLLTILGGALGLVVPLLFYWALSKGIGAAGLALLLHFYSIRNYLRERRAPRAICAVGSTATP